MFKVFLTKNAKESLETLAKDKSLQKRLKAAKKTIGLLQKNPRHPSLKTHKFLSILGPNGEQVFEAYAENKTPSAYRVFWYYGPTTKTITILAITPHP